MFIYILWSNCRTLMATGMFLNKNWSQMLWHFTSKYHNWLSLALFLLFQSLSHVQLFFKIYICILFIYILLVYIVSSVPVFQGIFALVLDLVFSIPTRILLPWPKPEFSQSDISVCISRSAALDVVHSVDLEQVIWSLKFFINFHIWF